MAVGTSWWKGIYSCTQKGQKERLVELAHKNAALVLTQDAEKLRREEERTLGAMQEIADLLGMSEVKRVESYDISNISGFQSVGSMVVLKTESRSAAITVSSALRRCKARMIMPAWKRCLEEDFVTVWRNDNR